MGDARGPVSTTMDSQKVSASAPESAQNPNKVDMIVSQLNAGFSAMLDRALHAPCAPVANATSSYWMDAPPFPQVNRNPRPLPSDIVDYAIIGTGITGLAAARTLLELCHDQHTEMPLKVVALEARDVCAGATGRNGGHVKAAPYRDFAALKKALGGDARKAAEVLRFMLSHVDLLGEVGGEVNEGEVRRVEAVDLFFEEGDWEEAKVLVEDVKKSMADLEIHVWTGEEAVTKFGCSDLIAGAISYPAGAAFPFRLVTGGWKAMVDKYPELTLHSNTPVSSISIAANSPQHPYMITTSAGSFRTRHVLHATNAYAPNLLPGLRPALTGGRGCMSAQDGGSRFLATHGNRSWSVVYSPGFDYVTQRPDGEGGEKPGDVMVGGGFYQSKLQGIDLLGQWDDSKRDALPLVHVKGVMPTVFGPEHWGGGDGGGEVKKDWTGIMGFTGDGLPFVGAVPQDIAGRTHEYPGGGVGGEMGSGEWIAAGFNGHGMVWSWLSGAAAAVMMVGKQDEELSKVVGRPGGKLAKWFPGEVVRLDAERLKRADLKNLGKL